MQTEGFRYGFSPFWDADFFAVRGWSLYRVFFGRYIWGMLEKVMGIEKFRLQSGRVCYMPSN